jgi:hypothetical protein
MGIKIMINRDKNLLKARLPARQGQKILAQGKRLRSVALGLRANREIVREMVLIKEQILFRTKEKTSIFREMLNTIPSERSFFALIIMFPRTVFSGVPYTQGVAVRPSSRRGPGLKSIGLSVRKNILLLTCV